MTRETTTIQLSKCTVEVNERITWGEKERLQEAIQPSMKIQSDGTKEVTATGMFEAKIKLVEFAVVKITFEDGSEQKFTRQWVENLDQDDGDLLFETVDNLYAKKKVTTGNES